jgi:signal transduction histidine kinase
VLPTRRRLGPECGLMDNESIDPRWPKLLSLAVHEFRTPITVVAGYLRMVLKERAGPISDQQRKLLEEAEKSCGRLSGLVAEMSDISGLEAGLLAFNRSPVDLTALLREVVSTIPDLPDRSVSIKLEAADTPVTIAGDFTRLRTAFVALVTALRREVVASDQLIVRHTEIGTSSTSIISIGAAEQIDAVASADPASLERFDEWRGGSGLSLAVARRVIAQHGGALFSPPGGGKAAALVVLERVAT